MKFFVSCAKGLEYLLVDELAALGVVATATVAGVNAQGELSQALRAVMWSRLASRVLWPLTDFDCPDEAALYAGVAALAWPEHLGAEQTLAVDAHVSGTGVTHARFAAQRVKDAVVDRFRAQELARPSVDVAAPDLRLNLVLRKGRAWLSVDLGGGPLHRRGWRIAQGEAPLKEHLAAAVLLRAQWPDRYRNGGWLLDPMCGSGTLLIEGALMAADVAPGLLRHGGSPPSRWRGFDADAWQALREEAQQREWAGRAALRPLFFGSDADPHAIEAARLNAMQAGVHEAIRWEVRDIDQWKAPATPASGGMPASSGETPVADAETQGVPGWVAAAATVVCNPPYDARLAADPQLYRRLGTALQRVAPEGRASLLCGSPELAFATGLRAARSYQVFNGALECVLIVCDPIRPAARATSGERALSEGAAMVANRLRKNLRKLKRWREQESVSCFRAYDADLPEYAAAVDVYGEDTDAGAVARTFLHVQEYAAPASVPEADARRRLRELLAATREVFGVPPEQVALKARRRGKGGAKYADVGANGASQGGASQGGVITVREHGARLQVNLFDYLDTGLFLDHRPLRGRMAQDARGRRFLNLFSYTGVASVQAAVAGAAATTSVDLSATYLQWCAENLRLNGLGGHAHQLVQADVLRWLEAERGRYDLIFCDPPTFSNSARAEDFDVQRDHVRLLRAAVGRLAQGGVLYFSNNFRRFRLDEDAVAAFAQCEDITASTLPPDFERNPRIHRCWRLTQGAAAPMRDSANSMST